MRWSLVLALAACSPSPGSDPAPRGWLRPVARPSVQVTQPPSEHYVRASDAQATTFAHAPAMARFAAEHPGAWSIDVDPRLGTLRALSGDGLALQPADALAFVTSHRDLFGGDFVLDGSADDGQLAFVQLQQRYHGLPVVAGHLGLAIEHGELVLVHGTTFPVDGLDPTPRLTRDEAIAGALVGTGMPVATRADAKLVVWPDGRTPHLAWQTELRTADAFVRAYVDAHTGALLAAHDGHRYDFGGAAKIEVDPRTVGDPLAEETAAYLGMTIDQEQVYTDERGSFLLRSSSQGRGALDLGLQGRYVTVDNRTGKDAEYLAELEPGMPMLLDVDNANSDIAERDVYRGTTITNRFIARYFPTVPWLNKALRANVNLNQTCNAYWDGYSINFFREGRGCNNTGRIFDVVAHEWGHAFDQHGPGADIDGGLGEFIGDLISFVQTDSPVIGENFLVGGGGVRDLTDPEYRCFDPRKTEVHDAGHLLGTVVWDIREDLKRAGVDARQIDRIMLLPIAGAQTRSEWYRAMVAVDDDDGNLANGTPHECLIYKQFVAHSCAGTLWPGVPSEPPAGCVP
ncbi:MAG TPA: hypothetical protein VFQ53_39290 [Kofleriaceae bacterium]|nr:hypothetical protein [Kofleriaceae bacterium]